MPINKTIKIGAFNSPHLKLAKSDECFYFEPTNELFTDYERFFQRAMECDLTSWSCALTGQMNLTFEQAFDSELRISKELCNFSPGFVRAVLFLFSHTNRTRLQDAADDVCRFLSDRYFVDEIIRIENSSNNFHIKEVSIKSGCEKLCPPIDQLKYRLVNGDVDIRDVEFDKLHRPGFSPLSIKFIIQKCSSLTDGRYILTEIAKEQFGLNGLSYADICAGSLPRLETYGIVDQRVAQSVPKSKLKSAVTAGSASQERTQRLDKAKQALRKAKQAVTTKERLEKAGKATDMKSRKHALKQKDVAKKQQLESKLKELALQMQLKEKEERRRLLILEKQKKLIERQKAIEERRKKVQEYREWLVARDDMLCNDLKLLPKFEELRLDLTDLDVGLFLSAFQFLHAFVHCKPFETSVNLCGESIATLRQLTSGVQPFLAALSENCCEGSFPQLLISLLRSVFALEKQEIDDLLAAEDLQEPQESEPANIAARFLNEENISKWIAVYTGNYFDVEEANDVDTIDLDSTDAKLRANANVAALIGSFLLGMCHSEITLDATSISEVVRMYLLGAGADPLHLAQNLASWSSLDQLAANLRSYTASRGCLSATDHPGWALKKQNPRLIAQLTCGSVYALSPGDKLQLVSCLTEHLMSISSVRETIDTCRGERRRVKGELRELERLEAQRVREEQVARAYFQAQRNRTVSVCGTPTGPNGVANCNGTAAHDDGGKKRTNSVPVDAGPADKKLKAESGTDAPHSLNVTHSLLTPLFKNVDLKLMTERQCNDFWNRTNKELVRQRADFFEQQSRLRTELAMYESCSRVQPLGGDRCYRRYFYLTSMPSFIFIENPPSDEVPAELLQPTIQRSPSKGTSASPALETQSEMPNHNPPPADSQPPSGSKVEYETYIIPASHTWTVLKSKEQLDALLECLNPRGHRESALLEVLKNLKSRFYQMLHDLSVCDYFKVPRRATEVYVYGMGVLERNVRDFILDIEDKLFHGGLGYLQVKDRDAWRDTLMKGGYDPQVETLDFRDLVADGWVESTAEWQISSNDSLDEDVSRNENEDRISQVLSRAVYQVAACINQKFIVAPLGTQRAADGKRTEQKELPSYKRSRFRFWARSLLASHSYSQIHLHLQALEKSIYWAKSLLRMSCKVCKRKTDEQSMLLCDGCDFGFHLYCLRPKLTHVPVGEWFCPACRRTKRD